MEPALARLSPRQRARLGDWLPGAHLVEDLSWGYGATRVLRLEHEGRAYVLKAGGPGDHHLAREVEAHLRWLGPWRARGSCPRLVRHDVAAPVLLTEWLPGTLAEGTTAELDPSAHREAGRLLALLHAQTDAEQRDPGWVQREDERLARRLAQPHRMAPTTLASALDRLADAPSDPVRVVPTHGDWQPRNWLVDAGGTLRAIDLGRAGLRPPGTDIARLAVQQWRGRPELESAFLAGYGGDPREDASAWQRTLVREAVGTAVWAYGVGDEGFEAQGHRMLAQAVGSPLPPPLPRRLETSRLVLTPRRADDAAWVARLHTARGRGEVTPETAAQRISTAERVFEEIGIGPFALRRREDGASLGYVALVLGRSHVEEPELAYELLPQHHGQGYATEAAQALLEAAWATGRRRLWLTTRPANLASRRVAARLGFTEDRRTADEHGPILWLCRDAP